LPQFESQFEENLYNERREKLAKITALGQSAYPNQFLFSPADITVPQIKAQFADATGEALEADKPQFAIAGRLVAIRLQGKAGFAQLRQGGEALQIYVRKDNVGDSAFELYKLLDLGDHVGVSGHLFRTRTNELTLQVQALTFLTKAMLPLPDKFSGLGDVELRYRRRYLDLFTDNGDFEQTETEGEVVQTRAPAREVFVKRAAVLRAIRKFFDERGYFEVETPMLHTVAGGAAARPFTTHHNALDMDLSLRIAPELYLKRLVVGGLDRVYEINRNFRNEGVSTRHNPEFTMLEFYQAYANYEDLMKLTPELIEFVAMQVNGTAQTHFNSQLIDLATHNWTKLSMSDCIRMRWPVWAGNAPSEKSLRSNAEFAKFSSRSLSEPHLRENFVFEDAIAEEGVDPNTRSLLRQLLLLSSMGNDVGSRISAIFELLAEPHLIQPTIIYDFPLAVSPLSKVKPDEPEWVERFEFYIGGFEIGNAFSELNDPADQHARFEAQVADKDPDSMAEVDHDYVRALGYGLPPTAGEGIGIDRLTMLLTGSKSIRDVILFPLMRPQKSHTVASSDEGTSTPEES
jgi:lysyl-tRNA synthetase class 2